MLRQAVCWRRLPHASIAVVRRHYAAGKQPSSIKRALTEEQLKGTAVKAATLPKAAVKPATSSATAATATTATTATTAAKPASPNGGVGGGDPSAGGGEFMLPVAVVATTLGAAWYFDMIPGMGPGLNTVNKKNGEVAPVQQIEELSDNDVVVEEQPTVVAVVEEVVAPVVVVEQKEEEPAAAPEPEPTPEPVVEATPEPTPEPAATPEPAITPEPATTPAPATTPEPIYTSATEATKELMTASEESSAKTLQKAHHVLQASVDESLYSDLEELTAADLKIRIVQLGTQMTDRVKWEAVRLKEFLAMKEKEVGETYMELMQKQRLEFEDMLARKLREQEDAMSRQSNAALAHKEAGIQAVVTATQESLAAEHDANLNSQKEFLETELNAKYEVEYATKLTEEKQRFVDELEKKVAMLESQAAKLEEMEQALSVSRSFTDGSVKAHRVSAAALALAQKLESSQGASPQVGALEIVAAENTVIASAVSSIPDSIKSGIPTLSELQTKFGKVYEKSRQAALVPAGRSGLEGQLVGAMLKKLKYAPSPDDPAPEETKDDAEYVLARARRHVQLGELERAMEQLDKLQGQVAFTVKDWKKNAQDRIAADKALHVIKMEVALMNESLSNAVE